MRDLLARGMATTAQLVRGTVDAAARRGRTTGDDARELVESLIQIGARQARDLVAELQAATGRGSRRAERSADEVRMRARSRGDATPVARRSSTRSTGA